jgi:hypothetical protein
MTRIKKRIAERFTKYIFEQLVHQPAAAPMCHQHLWILRDWKWAARHKMLVLFHDYHPQLNSMLAWNRIL